MSDIAALNNKILIIEEVGSLIIVIISIAAELKGSAKLVWSPQMGPKSHHIELPLIAEVEVPSELLLALGADSTNASYVLKGSDRHKVNTAICQILLNNMLIDDGFIRRINDKLCVECNKEMFEVGSVHLAELFFIKVKTHALLPVFILEELGKKFACLSKTGHLLVVKEAKDSVKDSNVSLSLKVLENAYHIKIFLIFRGSWLEGSSFSVIDNLFGHSFMLFL